jgi:hypothetical protein
MKRRDRSRRKKRLDYFAGAALMVIGLFGLGALAGAAWWLKATEVEIDESTNCPKGGPRSVHLLIFDRTDPVSAQQAQRIEQYVTRLMKDAGAGQRFDLYTVEGDTQQVLRAVLEICSPGQGKDASEITQNPAHIQQRFETKFVDVLQRTVNELLQASKRPTSPIIESMRAASISSFGPLDTRVPLHLTIVSDMVQHSPLLSHFKTAPNFKELSRSEAWRALQPDLRRADVDILYLLRPTALRAGVPVQTRGHQLFWEDLIPAANGRIMSIQPI